MQARTHNKHTQSYLANTQIIDCSVAVFKLMLVICYTNLKLVHLATASLFSAHSFGDLFLENPKQNINSI